MLFAFSTDTFLKKNILPDKNIQTIILLSDSVNSLREIEAHCSCYFRGIKPFLKISTPPWPIYFMLGDQGMQMLHCFEKDLDFLIWTIFVNSEGTLVMLDVSNNDVYTFRQVAILQFLVDDWNHVLDSRQNCERLADRRGHVETSNLLRYFQRIGTGLVSRNVALWIWGNRTGPFKSHTNRELCRSIREIYRRLSKIQISEFRRL